MCGKIYNASFLVVLYNKTISESTTLSTLINSNINMQGSRLVIWNNGPNSINLKGCKCFKEKGFDVTFIETLENESLAVIYNDFIDMFSSEKYIILDDDSLLNEKYLQNVFNSSSDNITIPVIKMNNRIQSPIIDNVIYNEENCSLPEKKVMAIGSGLVIGNNLINIFYNKYGNIFDEHFYLYGVDSSFFHRVNNLLLTSKISVVEGMNHSLSRLEEESDSIKNFRKLERTYDYALSIRYYCSNIYKIIFYVLKINLSVLIKKLLCIDTVWSWKHFNRAIITGRHYRFSKKKSKKIVSI